MSFFIAVLILTSNDNTVGDPLTCAGSIVIFSAFMLFDTTANNNPPLVPLLFVAIALIWGFLIQPSVFNRCHLTIWMMLIESLRNFLVIESHATMSWGFSTLTNAYRVVHG